MQYTVKMKYVMSTANNYVNFYVKCKFINKKVYKLHSRITTT